MLRLNRFQKLFAIFFIPRGMYCDECPFWSKDKKHSRRENGYCSYLGKGDWEINDEMPDKIEVDRKREDGTYYIELMDKSKFPYQSLLWDKCKECGIKYSTKISSEDKEMFDNWFNTK